MHVSILLLLTLTISSACGWVTFHSEERTRLSEDQFGNHEYPGHRDRNFNENPRFFKSPNGNGRDAQAEICDEDIFPWCLPDVFFKPEEKTRHLENQVGNHDHGHRHFNVNPRFFVNPNGNGAGHAAQDEICETFPWCFPDVFFKSGNRNVAATAIPATEHHSENVNGRQLFTNSGPASKFMNVDEPMPRKFFSSNQGIDETSDEGFN